MNTLSTHPNTNLIEKQYPYRTSWSSTIAMLLVGGLGTIGVYWLGKPSNTIWMWLFIVLFSALFLFGLWITLINLQDKLRFIVTKDGLYFPILWKFNSYNYVPFSNVSKVELLEFQGNVVLQLYIGNKIFGITEAWLPSSEAFKEVVDFVTESLLHLVQQDRL